MQLNMHAQHFNTNIRLKDIKVSEDFVSGKAATQTGLRQGHKSGAKTGKMFGFS